MPRFSLIVPLFRSEENLPSLLDAVEYIGQSAGMAFEAVFVVDGSPDRCYELLREELPRRACRSRLILLSRNFGSFAAIRAGLEHASGDFFAMMAADLQEPPDLILEMLERLRADEADVVIAERIGRDDPFTARIFSSLFWRAYKKFVVPEVPIGGVDVFGCNRAFRDELVALREQRSSLIGQIFWLGHRRASVTYLRRHREVGRSAWSWRKKLDYLTDSVFAFTDLPIRLLTRAGGFTALFSGLLATMVIVCRLLDLIKVPGYAALILATIFFGSLNLFGLGIVGSFAWRAYENTKGRPLHIVLQNREFARAETKSA